MAASAWKSLGHPYPLLQLVVIDTQATKPTAIRTNFKEDTFMFDISFLCYIPLPLKSVEYIFVDKRLTRKRPIKVQNYLIYTGFFEKNTKF